jgi:hypothetical protein
MKLRLLQKTLTHFGISFLMLTLGIATVSSEGLGPPHAGFWIDDSIYYTIGTPTADLPDKGPTDGLYVFLGEEDGGLDGQTPVGESKPGDTDFNGGRWEVTVLTFTDEGKAVHDPDDDGEVNFELTNWEQVQHHIGLGHLAVVGPGPRFECPVIKKAPQNNRAPSSSVNSTTTWGKLKSQ